MKIELHFYIQCIYVGYCNEKGRKIAETVIWLIHTAQDLVQFQGICIGICDGETHNGKSFPKDTALFSCQSLFHHCAILIHLPFSGRKVWPLDAAFSQRYGYILQRR